MMKLASTSKPLAGAVSPYAKTVIGQFNGVLSQRNTSDDYTLTVNQRGSFSARLSKLQQNAALQLRTSDGRVIARSNKPGRRAEFIRKTLDPGTYFVRVLRSAGRTRYTLTISDNSNASNSPINPPPSTNLFQNLWGVYQGFAETTIGAIDPLSGQFTRVSTFQTSIVSEISAPKAAAGVVESNPFNVFVGSSPAEIAANVEGAISVYSAIPFNFRGGFLLQYWSIQYTNNQISGTLINRDSGAALTTNLFNSRMDFGLGFGLPFPYAMDIGTTLQGTLTPTELRIRIQGFDSGRTRAFVSNIVAQRR